MAMVIALSAAFGASVVTTDAQAASKDTLVVQPASGMDSTPLSVVSSGVCPSGKGGYLMAKIFGSGFPAQGQNVVPNQPASIYTIDRSAGGYDVPLQDTLQSFAALQSPPARLSGRYTIDLYCQSTFGTTRFQTYSATLVFSSPSHYAALTQPSPSASPNFATTAEPRPTAASPRPAATTKAPPAVGVTTPASVRRPAPAQPTRTAVKSTSVSPSRSSSSPTTQAPPTTPPLEATTPAGTTPPDSAPPSTAAVFVAASRPAPPDRTTDTALIAAIALLSLAAVAFFVLRRRLSRSTRP
jgi:hypothetical protein